MPQDPLPPFADRVDTPMLLHDPETGSVVGANDAAEELYGYRVTEITGLPIEVFSSESPQFTVGEAEQRIQAAADGAEQRFEWQIERKSGELRWVDVHLERITLDGEVYVLAQNRDITNFKERTRRLRLLYRIIRHNLRNDMAKIMGFAGTIEETVTDETARRQAERIERVTERVGEMTDAVTRLEGIATSDETDRSPTDVVAVLQDLGRRFESRYPDATVRVGGATEAWVAAGQGLQFALENALENAIIHNDAANPRVTCRVTVDPEGDMATITISDNGPPIPEMELAALDDVGETTELDHGTGVGLFAMKWCTQWLGGEFDITKNDSGGTVVEFSLPTCEEEAASGQGVAAPGST